MPAKLRIWGFTKMMYDMTMKVVTPAIVSRASVVPFAAKRKRRSRNVSPACRRRLRHCRLLLASVDSAEETMRGAADGRNRRR